MFSLHELEILHNKLKATNFLVHPKKNHHALEVVDFEFSVAIKGTRFQRALEILHVLRNRNLQQETFTQLTTRTYGCVEFYYDMLCNHYKDVCLLKAMMCRILT